MKTKTRAKTLSLLLAVAMFCGTIVAIGNMTTVDTSAAVAGATLPAGAEVWDGTTVSESLEGSGTEIDPYLIQSNADFMYFFNTASIAATAGTYFKMTADVYKNSAASFSAGTFVNEGYLGNFAGILDGDGHSIYNWAFQNKTQNWVATSLFNSLTGTVKNLTFRGCRVNGSAGNCAVLAQTINGGTVSNVHVEELSYVNAMAFGGLVYSTSSGGTAANLIENCSVSASAPLSVNAYNADWQKGQSSFGGILSQYASNGTDKAPTTIRNCEYNMDLVTTYLAAGGIAGKINGTGSLTITGCTSRGSLVMNAAQLTTGATDAKVGGIIGENNQTNGFTINNCVNYADVTLVNELGSAGGITGSTGASVAAMSYNSLHAYNLCTNYGKVTAPVYAGGIIGCAQIAISAQNSANYGDVTATGTNGIAGGFIGYSNGNVTRGSQAIAAGLRTYNCVQDGTVTGQAAAGGLMGEFVQSSVWGINDTYGLFNGAALYSTLVAGTVTAGTKVGGIIGTSTYEGDYGGTHISLFSTTIAATLNATADTEGYVGMLVGHSINTTYTVSVDASSYVNKNGLTLVAYGKTVNTASWNEYNGAKLTDGTIQNALNAYVTANAGKEYYPWVQNASAPALVNNAKLTGASIDLTGELTLKLKLNASVLGALTPGEIAVSDGEDVYVGTLTADDEYVFVISGIRAADIANAKEYTLVATFDSINYTSLDTVLYSPLLYAERMYVNGDTDASVKNVLLGLVAYGNAADVSLNGASTMRTDFIAATGAEATVFDGLTAFDMSAITDADVVAIGNTALVGATLTSGVNLVFTEVDATVAKLVVTVDEDTFTYDKALDGTITVTDLHAGLLLNKVQLSFRTAEDVSVKEASMTIGNFLSAQYTAAAGNATLQALAQATAYYMTAVRAYALEQEAY